MRGGLRKNLSKITAMMATWNCYSARSDTTLYARSVCAMVFPEDQSAEATEKKACQYMMPWEILRGGESWTGNASENSSTGSKRLSRLGGNRTCRGEEPPF